MRRLLSIAILSSWPAVADAACGSGPVVLNELLVDPAGIDAGAEWVELLRPAGPDVDVSGWRVERATQPGGWAVVFELPAGVVLSAGLPLAVAGPAAAVGPDALVLAAHADLGNAGTGSDAVRLVDCAGAVVDVVVYGAANAPGQVFPDELGLDVGDDRLAPRPVPDRALARVPDGADTADGSADLVVRDPTPGAPNAPPPVDTDAPLDSGADTADDEGPADTDVTDVAADTDVAGCVPGGRTVVLNELLADPAGADDGSEWVELLARAEVSLGGWRVEASLVPGQWRPVFVVPPGVRLAAGSRLVLAGPGAAVPGAVALPATTTLGNAGGSADAVRLVDCAGAVVDVVAYGRGGAEPFTDEAGVPIGDDRLAPGPAAGRSLARLPDGVDHDDGGDLALADPPTPGAPNGTTDAPPTDSDVVNTPCAAAGGGVRVEALLPDAVGPDGPAGTELVALRSSSPVALDLAGWAVVARTTAAGAERLRVTLPAGTRLAPGARLVVGGPAAEDVDVPVDGFDLGSGAGGDLVWLADCTGARVDGVVYGGENRDGLAEDDGAVPALGADRPKEGHCLLRAGEVDRDASALDFVTSSWCTPPDAAEPGDDVATDAPPPSGCGRATRDGGPRLASEGGCALGGRGSGPAWVLALVAAAARRRGWARGLPPE